MKFCEESVVQVHGGRIRVEINERWNYAARRVTLSYDESPHLALPLKPPQIED